MFKGHTSTNGRIEERLYTPLHSSITNQSKDLQYLDVGYLPKYVLLCRHHVKPTKRLPEPAYIRQTDVIGSWVLGELLMSFAPMAPMASDKPAEQI